MFDSLSSILYYLTPILKLICIKKKHCEFVKQNTKNILNNIKFQHS